MFVRRTTMDAAVAAERERSQELARRFGEALSQVTGLQKQLEAWLMNKAGDITPEQFAQMFYAQDDRWQAAFFNTMQAQVQAHHDALPADQVWGKSPGVPAGEAQWWHVAQHLNDSGFETLEAMFWHAKSTRTAAEEEVAA